MSNLWWVNALIGSLLSAAYLYANQAAKLPSTVIMVYRGLLFALMLMPFYSFFSLPENPMFYVYCTLQGLIVAFIDKRVFSSARKYGADITSSMIPIALAITFVLWMFIVPSQFFELLSHPLKFSLIILCLLGVIFSLWHLKNGEKSSTVFYYMLPVLFLASCSDILNKQSMLAGGEDLSSSIFYYLIISGFFAGLPNLYLCHKQGKIPELFTKNHLKLGVAVCLILFTCMIFKNTAMYATPNPAYVSAVIYMNPIWIICGNHLYSWIKKDRLCSSCNVKVVAVLLTSVVGLILLK